MTPCKKMQLEEEPPSFRLLECQIRNTSYVTATLCVECKKTFSKFYDLKKTKRKLLLATYFKVFDNLVVIVKFVTKSQLIFPFRPFVFQKKPEQFLSKRMPEMIKNSLRVSYLHCIYDTTVL